MIISSSLQQISEEFGAVIAGQIAFQSTPTRATM